MRILSSSGSVLGAISAGDLWGDLALEAIGMLLSPEVYSGRHKESCVALRVFLTGRADF